MLELFAYVFFGSFFVPLVVVLRQVWTARLGHGRGRPLPVGHPVVVVRPRD